MTLEAAALVLVSALLHPVRDLLLKGHARPESAYLAVTAGWVAIALVHCLATGADLALPQTVWPSAVISAASLTAYYSGTMAALKTGDLSIYYPIIRSSPLLIVVVSWTLWDTAYSTAVLGGIVLIVVSGFALQRQPGRLVARPVTATLALIAMAGSAGYTMADAHAMRLAGVTPEAFLFWVYMMVAPAFALLAWIFKPREFSPGEYLFGGWSIKPLRLSAASLLSYVSYLAILLAFTLGAGAAETAAVRQASIPASVLMAALVLGETRFLHRLGWASLITAGIVLIILNR